MRNVTNLDRVMVYHFDKDWHGDILIELTGEGMQLVSVEMPGGCLVCVGEMWCESMLYDVFMSIRHSSKLLGSAVPC